MNIDLAGRTALVTGSTSGIGRAIAEGLARCGARVIVNGRDPGRTEAAARAIAEAAGAGAGDRVVAAPADVGSAAGVDALLAAAPDVDEAGRRYVREQRPTSLLGRLIAPEEVANAVVYLASEQASATTGAAVRVDGGVVRAIP